MPDHWNHNVGLCMLVLLLVKVILDHRPKKAVRRNKKGVKTMMGQELAKEIERSLSSVGVSRAKGAELFSIDYSHFSRIRNGDARAGKESLRKMNSLHRFLRRSIAILEQERRNQHD